MPAERWSRSAGPVGRVETANWSAAVELLGVRERGLGEDDRELVAADAAGDVGAADDRAHALGELREHGVAGQVADPLVDRLEVVDVEDDEREPAVVAVRAGDLARERVVEVAPVVEARERVEVGELARLAEAARVLDRRARVRGELLERGESRRRSASRPSSRQKTASVPIDSLAVARERHGERRRGSGSSRPPSRPFGA